MVKGCIFHTWLSQFISTSLLRLDRKEAVRVPVVLVHPPSPSTQRQEKTGRCAITQGLEFKSATPSACTGLDGIGYTYRRTLTGVLIRGPTHITQTDV